MRMLPPFLLPPNRGLDSDNLLADSPTVPLSDAQHHASTVVKIALAQSHPDSSISRLGGAGVPAANFRAV